MSHDDRGRQARRYLAMSRPELRGNDEFYFDATASLPTEGKRCTVMASDGDGLPYKLPFPVHRTDGQWFNSKFDRPLKVKIVKWRYE